MIYKSCELIEQGLYFLYDSILLCCYSIGTKGEYITLMEDFHGGKLDWDKLTALRKQIKDSHKKGIITPQCQGCVKLMERDWEEKNTINNIIISHWVKCNCNCAYCETRNKTEFYKNYKSYEILPIFKDMLKKNLIDFDGGIFFGGGEPTELKEFDKLLNFFTTNGSKQIIINTSAISHSKAIASALDKDAISLTISVDSGFAETYKKIKRTNTYNRVWDNIKKYVSAQGENKYSVKTKFIIIPNVNDNVEEIEQWLQKSIQNGIKSVSIDIESIWYFRNRNNIPTSLLELISYVQKRAEELKLEFTYYSIVDQLLNQKQ